MADGSLTISLDEETAERVNAAAEAAGETASAFVLRAVAMVLNGGWDEDMRIAAEVDRTGDAYPADEVLAELRAKRAARRA